MVFSVTSRLFQTVQDVVEKALSPTMSHPFASSVTLSSAQRASAPLNVSKLNNLAVDPSPAIGCQVFYSFLWGWTWMNQLENRTQQQRGGALACNGIPDMCHAESTPETATEFTRAVNTCYPSLISPFESDVKSWCLNEGNKMEQLRFSLEEMSLMAWFDGPLMFASGDKQLVKGINFGAARPISSLSKGSGSSFCLRFRQ